MAYKIGATTVIDDAGNIDWSRIANKPTIGTGDITGVTVSNAAVAPAGGSFGATLDLSGSASNNCIYNCYVVSLSGGGTSGSVTVTADRSYVNCNCNCRC